MLPHDFLEMKRDLLKRDLFLLQRSPPASDGGLGMLWVLQVAVAAMQVHQQQQQQVARVVGWQGLSSYLMMMMTTMLMRMKMTMTMMTVRSWSVLLVS
jgi:hypothetical protein